ncbi:MAG: ComF family protein [Deltaproteobacteria bacterium]|nr:ComF family protein [Deltaproteobacteria bacterium]
MSILNQLIDMIYPPRCPSCHNMLAEGDYDNEELVRPFCRSCFETFQQIESPLCPICGRPHISGPAEDHLCENCLRNRPYYDRCASPYLYEGNLMEAIHEFKYMQKSHLAGSFGPLLASFASTHFTLQDNLLVMPVPLHPKRLRERGFNQSLLLARHVASRLGAQLDFLSLRRVRYTKPQTELSKDERRKNVKMAFGILDKQVVKGRSVLLVDDVATTGNTLNECARVLKKSGAQKVLCVTLARTSLSQS